MRKVLVITFSDLKTDARVKRQISFFDKTVFDVTVACYDAPEEYVIVKMNRVNTSFVNRIISAILLLSKFYDKAYQLLYGQKLQLEKKFDLIVANDVEALPLAFQLKGNAKIIFDAHEYAPRHFENKMSWRIFFQGFNTYLCKKYIPQVNAMTTIGQGIAQEFGKKFGVSPTIITNAPPFHQLKPNFANTQKIKLIHQGAAARSRNLELMIEMMDMLDERFHLDFMLIEPTFKSEKKYLQFLKSLAQNNKRINFVPAKPTHELLNTLNQYDMGIILFPPVNFNLKNTLPNKFFECVQARIAIATGPTPEIKKLTEEYNMGVVSDDFTAKSLANKINSLTVEQINQFKQNTLKAAQELNAEKNAAIFNDLVSKTLG